MIDDRVEWISKRAYALWEEADRPNHCATDHWLQAVSERLQLEVTVASSNGAEVLTRTRKARSAARESPRGKRAVSGASAQISAIS